MNTTYNDVLSRLKEERCRLELTQKEMAQIVRMTQSNYSKIELGLRRFSYHELKYLCKSEIDVHYIFTGRKGEKEYTEIFEECSYLELTCYLCIIYSLIILRGKEIPVGQRKSILEKIKYVSLLEGNQMSDNIFFLLRRSMNCQQLKMAEMLGVDIKKLRDLENGRCMPDSELVYRLYDLFNIPPAIVLKDNKGLLSEIGVLLEMTDSRSGKGIFESVKALREMH